MQNQNKREQILDAMQELLRDSDIQAVSVSDIAQKAGIGKGSIYYYFSSKNEIISAVIERSYSRVLDEGKELAASRDMDVFDKMKTIYRACLNAASELKRQEQLTTFNELKESAFIHQKFCRIIISSLNPLLTDIIRQGIREGLIKCPYPEETARIILTVLTTTLDNNLVPSDPQQIGRVLSAFASMQENAMDIPDNTLKFLTDIDRKRV